MTETQRKALALLNEVREERGRAPWQTLSREYDNLTEALCRSIERDETFRQDVSDELLAWFGEYELKVPGEFARFIVPKPDPLVEAVGDAMQAHEVYSKYELTDSLRAALAARGLKIVEDK